MTSICPKCRHLRQPNETVPDWKCPACGVAYAKAGDAGRGVVPSVQSYGRLDGNDNGFPWGKLLLLAAVLWGVWAGWQGWHGGGKLSGGSTISQGSAAQKISALAVKVSAGDVVMYSTSVCPYCAQAKGWLSQNGFEFTECNMTTTPSCIAEFKSLGGDGTPFLVVRHGGKVSYMKDGFDSEEFLALLK
jgi:glutaredoxin